MPEAAITTIAKALVDELNDPARGWSQSFVAVREHDPKALLEQLNTLKVTVVPVGWERDRLDRDTNEYVWTVDIGVQKKVPASTLQTETETMIAFMEELDGYFAELPVLSEAQDYRCIGAETNPLFVPEHLRKEKQFTAVLRLTFSKE